MRYVSLFSGVEAATLAWGPLGWEAMAFCEVDPFPCAVLAHRYPEVPNLGDVREVDWGGFIADRGRPDVVVGGSPCQSFSIAGTRTGLDGASGLMWEYVRAVRELRPRCLVWENVPDALSSTRGEDFRCLLASLDELGYGLAWRVLDAQFFGVAQRRRRLFVVGVLGDPACACEVLFERAGVPWDPAPGREKRKELAARAGLRAEAAGGAPIPINTMVATRGNKLGRGTGFGVGDAGDPAYTVTAAHEHAVCAGFKFHQGAGAGGVGYEPEQSPTLTADWHNPAVVIGGDDRCEATRSACGGRPGGGKGPLIQEEVSGTLATSNDQTVICMTDTQANCMVDDELCGTLSCHSKKDPPVVSGPVVRRLTPRECERLQGMPGDWTLVPYRGKPADECPDGPRYKAIGNSMAVPVMRWIGERIGAALTLRGGTEECE